MRVLVVDAFPTESEDRVVVDAVLETLREGGHDPDHRVLAGGPFERFMSAEERAAYHTDEPLVTPEARADAAAVGDTDALLFCYPTTDFAVPAVLKSWLERVLVPGVAFVFDRKGRVRPGMTNVRRLGSVTTSSAGRLATARARDAGRRTIQRTLRLSCHRFCRRTFVRLDAGAPDLDRVRAAIARW